MGPRPVSRLLGTALLILAALACIVGGIALIYPPAGLVAAGVAILLAVTFDPAAVRRVTWPR